MLRKFQSGESKTRRVFSISEYYEKTEKTARYLRMVTIRDVKSKEYDMDNRLPFNFKNFPILKHYKHQQ